MPMSTSSAPARPIMSAPTPRAGSSTRWVKVYNSPTTTSAASRGDVPGQEPMPVAAAKILTRPTVFDGSANALFSTMPASARMLLVGCAMALAMAGTMSCTHTVTGSAARSAPGIDDDSRSPVDVDGVLLEQSQMRAITGAGEHLTVIPSMDGKLPVDIDQLADTAPPPCRWYFAETQTFGPEVEEFH